ncbi:MAG: gliding motility-associated C-terminal domain-containing protein [Prevotella sp.]|nr:gliding motility-associated C-terminal domain-containing protein [Bacteroides sp.]MCM1365664.1 gliding motility-associated C-terminal domain-containing protein [Prevotella sp.]
MLRKIILVYSLLCVTVNIVFSKDLVFSGNSKEVIVISPEKSTGIDEIYVTWGGGENLDASFQYSGSESPRWYRYSNLGGGFAEEVSGVENVSGKSTLRNITPGYGYIIESGDRRYYYYLLDYSSHPLRLESIQGSSESDCTATYLTVSGEGSPLVYYTINGQQKSLDREIRLLYDTEEWDESSNSFQRVSAEKSIVNFSERIMVTPPVYCSTYFTLEGDRFLKKWGLVERVESSVIEPKAVEVKTEATEAEESKNQEASGEDEKSNEIHSPGSELGGSAPAEINFYAYGTEGVIHNEWQMSTDPDFENVTYRINDRNLNFVFRDEGMVYVRFVGSNYDGSCESYGDVYTINIGASELHCPNAFSPGASEGVNDEWKVSYKSLVDFKCWIFDRYGTQMCYFDDPSKGWDGKYKGKLVKPGVYYYVIQATGSEGKKYKKSGDINIIRYKSYSGQSTSE